MKEVNLLEQKRQLTYCSTCSRRWYSLAGEWTQRQQKLKGANIYLKLEDTAVLNVSNKERRSDNYVRFCLECLSRLLCQ